MTKATRAGSKLDQLLGRSPTAGLSVSSGHPDAKYLRGGTIADALTPPAYTITARVLHWITAFLILLMIPTGVVIANDWGGFLQIRCTICISRWGRCSSRSSFYG